MNPAFYLKMRYFITRIKKSGIQHIYVYRVPNNINYKVCRTTAKCFKNLYFKFNNQQGKQSNMQVPSIFFSSNKTQPFQKQEKQHTSKRFCLDSKVHRKDLKRRPKDSV